MKFLFKLSTLFSYFDRILNAKHNLIFRVRVAGKDTKDEVFLLYYVSLILSLTL